MNRIIGVILVVLSLGVSCIGQNVHRKNFVPIWSFHQPNINIHGLAVGLWSYTNDAKRTKTNGIKMEIIGLGMFVPLMPRSPIAQNEIEFNKLQNDPFSERINGIVISTSGTTCHCLTNGIAVGFVGQLQHQVNGVSASMFMNFTQKHNGVMAAFYFNEAYYMKGLQVGFANYGHKMKGIQVSLLASGSEKMTGLQIGLFNKSENFRGIQIGLWNVNQKRKFPLVNWNFKTGNG